MKRAAVILLLSIAGCGPSGPKTYPVSGKLDLPGGDVSPLAGSTVEIASAADPQVRAAGEIMPDGRFELETLHAGQMRSGALQGEYKARIVLADDDRATRQRAAKAVAKKYLSFETSGLTVSVPAAGDVAWTLSSK